MKQLDLFLPEVKHLTDKKIDISEVGIDFGDNGQRRIDLSRTSAFLKNIPSVTPPNGSVSVIYNPIAMSDSVASLTLNLAEKNKSLAASNL